MSNKAKNKKKNKNKAGQSKNSFFKVLINLLLAGALAAVVVLNIFTHVFSVVEYYGDSMQPAISDRQILVVRKTDKVSSGDIIAFYFNNKVLVRRIIAEGGTTVDIDSVGNVFLNGTKLEEPYVTNVTSGQLNAAFPLTVPYEEFFVMGDNRVVSMDSRLKELGTVPRNRVLGKVAVILG